MAWSQPKLEILSTLKDVIHQNQNLKNTIELCLNNQSPHPNYTVQDGLLYWKRRLVIPHKHELVNQILH